jgi:hypothetical protein
LSQARKPAITEALMKNAAMAKETFFTASLLAA